MWHKTLGFMFQSMVDTYDNQTLIAYASFCVLRRNEAQSTLDDQSSRRFRHMRPSVNHAPSSVSVNTIHSVHSAPSQPTLVPRPPAKPRSRSSLPTISRSETSSIIKTRNSYDDMEDDGRSCFKYTGCASFKLD